MEIKTKVKVEKWRVFLENTENALIYHTPEWQKFLVKTFGYKMKYLFLVNENDDIVGMLPLAYVKSRLFGSRLSCLPFAHICGYIGNKDFESILVNEAKETYTRIGANYLEIRDKLEINDKNFESINAFSTYILDLSPNIEEVWKKLDKSSVRWAIKKSQKEGVSVIFTKDIEDLKEFYELNCITKKKIGVPCHPWRFFRNLFEILSNYVLLYVAKYDKEIIGGGIMMYFKDSVIYGYGASNPRYLRLHPYHAFIWKSIENACKKGYKYFDFGRTSYSNLGLANFKKRWGTVEYKLYYSYYPKDARPHLVNTNTEKLYRIAESFIRHSPMIFYKKISDLIFGGVG